MKFGNSTKNHRIVLYVILSVVIILLGNYKVTLAQNEEEVKVVVNKNNEYDLNFDVEIEIVFKNKELYNENVFLSYHIYNEEGKDVQYENIRVPFSIDQNGEAKVKLPVDLSGLSKSVRNKKMIVKYDLVDQNNVYWFSSNTVINFETDVTNVVYNPLLSMYHNIVSEVKNHTVIFITNFFVFIFSFYGILKLKKNHLFI